ncbi:MAG TPA: peptidylprolyl isomerase [Pseudomonadales bacterium]|nr:peptidylprolyl isomerase [Pseudomonadales bacterium]
MNGKNILTTCVFVISLAAAFFMPAAYTQTLDKVVAVVNDDVIMASELALQVNLLAHQIKQAGQPLPPEEILQRQVLEKLIVESLQVQMGERAGVKVSNEQLDAAIESIAAQNKMSSATFQSELERQGIPLAVFRENVQRQIIIQQVQQALVIKRIDISEQDIDNFLNSEEGRRVAMQAAEEKPVSQSHARHILIKPSAIRNDEETQALLQKISTAVQKGGDFAALAKKYSEDPGSAMKGGDLGWSSPGQMVPEFEQMVENTELGKVSPPFRTQYGWHIVQVLERREQNMSEQILRQQAQMILRKRQFQDELPRWLKELRDKAYIQIKS